MKILSVRVHNLNSLKGEHLVRFDAEPLASAGLFAITGPTGAGKTTLLDAITLALYGKVARYGNESNPEHVMTRHCGECSAEVEFAVPSGQYRAVWERHKAGKKSTGKLQAPKRYIYDAAGEPLAQQIREAEQKIEDLLGLNYDRFLRSVLLAQGDFARFLKADANERAGLLESLTGTAIYSRLSELAHLAFNKWNSEYDAKVAEHGQIVILEKEERSGLEADLKKGAKRHESLDAELESGAAMLGKISRLQEAREKAHKASLGKEELELEKKKAAPDLQRLQLHRSTLPFSQSLSTLEHAERQAANAVKKQKEAEEKYSRSKEVLDQSGAVLFSSIGIALTREEKCVAEAKSRAVAAEESAKEAAGWIEKHSEDATLGGCLGEIVAAIADVKNARSQFGRMWRGWNELAESLVPKSTVDLEDGSAFENQSKEIIQLANGRLEERKKEGTEAKKQLEIRKDHLEKSRRLAQFEQHRADLKAGEKCPLCGATEHPYAEEGDPGTGFSELEKEVAKADAALDKAREDYRTFADKLKLLESDREDLLESAGEKQSGLKSLEGLLSSLSLPVPNVGEEGDLQAALQKRVSLFREQEKVVEAGAKRKAEAENQAKIAAELVRGLSAKSEKYAALKQLEELDAAPIAVDDAEDFYTASVQEEKVAESRLKTCQDEVKEGEKDLESARKELSNALADSPIEDIEALKQAHLPAAQFDELEEWEDRLKEKTAAWEALFREASKEVEELVKESVLEGEEAAEFLQKHNALKAERDELLEAQTTRRNAIKTDDENRQRKSENEKSLEEDKKRIEVWRRLKELIGSHDGAKFRKHAQSISLDILTRHANKHLVKLSDRYRIRRDMSGELNLEIEDLHQAGAKRPMASLSGGESFLASLALALGLSDLAGRNVRIDSLFIDEGFGSLDPDTLEVAIATLESLQQENKTVGVISHVDLLKERIGTQIVVEKGSGGVSEIRVVPELV